MTLHLDPRPEWTNQAACRGMGPAVWFPGRGEQTAHLKDICSGCPVAADCLQYALDNDIKHGIFGGMSERQRRRIRSDRYHGRVA